MDPALLTCKAIQFAQGSQHEHMLNVILELDLVEWAINSINGKEIRFKRSKPYLRIKRRCMPHFLEIEETKRSQAMVQCFQFCRNELAKCDFMGTLVADLTK